MNIWLGISPGQALNERAARQGLAEFSVKSIASRDHRTNAFRKNGRAPSHAVRVHCIGVLQYGVQRGAA